MENDIATPPSSTSAITTTPRPIHLPLLNRGQNPEVLIFNLETIKRLRDEHGILGILIGTLPQYPQQNLFLSIPLKLIVWEVVWLVENGFGVLVDQLKYRNLKAQAGFKNLNKISLGNKAQEEVANFNIIKNCDLDNDDDENEELISTCIVPLEEYISDYLRNGSYTQDQFLSGYHKFKHLKNLGYYISPGLKFGGDLVIYPGDPLRYHSYSIVKFDFVDLNEIIVGGRLATGVKKNMIIMDTSTSSSQKSEHQSLEEELHSEVSPIAFSIEWAGFG